MFVLQPERKDELARIEAAGGRVISWGGYRVLGVLAMSRAIGEFFSKERGSAACIHVRCHLCHLF